MAQQRVGEKQESLLSLRLSNEMLVFANAKWSPKYPSQEITAPSGHPQRTTDTYICNLPRKMAVHNTTQHKLYGDHHQPLITSLCTNRATSHKYITHYFFTNFPFKNFFLKGALRQVDKDVYMMMPSVMLLLIGINQKSECFWK
jgi:hypothetical protein